MRDARRDVVRRGYDEIAERYVTARTWGGDVALLTELVTRLRPGEALRETVPFAGVLGVEVVESGPEEVRARVEWRPERCTAGGVLHGGVLMSLADTTGATCAVQNLPDDASGTTTIESKTNFLRAVRDGYAEAVSRPLYAGRTVVVIETDITDAGGRPVVKVLQTQAVLRG